LNINTPAEGGLGHPLNFGRRYWEPERTCMLWSWLRSKACVLGLRRTLERPLPPSRRGLGRPQRLACRRIAAGGRELPSLAYMSCSALSSVSAAGLSPDDASVAHIHFIGLDVDESGVPYMASIPVHKVTVVVGDALSAASLRQSVHKCGVLAHACLLKKSCIQCGSAS
jgi:hypothetical protein